MVEVQTYLGVELSSSFSKAFLISFSFLFRCLPESRGLLRGTIIFSPVEVLRNPDSPRISSNIILLPYLSHLVHTASLLWLLHFLMLSVCFVPFLFFFSLLFRSWLVRLRWLLRQGISHDLLIQILVRVLRRWLRAWFVFEFSSLLSSRSSLLSGRGFRWFSRRVKMRRLKNLEKSLCLLWLD